jgi:hypothetical protein
MIVLQTVGLLGRVISSSQGLCLNTWQHKHRINTYTYQTSMPCVGFELTIQTDPGLRASEDSTYLRPLGYRDRLYLTDIGAIYAAVKLSLNVTTHLHFVSRLKIRGGILPQLHVYEQCGNLLRLETTLNSVILGLHNYPVSTKINNTFQKLHCLQFFKNKFTFVRFPPLRSGVRNRT